MYLFLYFIIFTNFRALQQIPNKSNNRSKLIIKLQCDENDKLSLIHKLIMRES
jgi:hypothetical protein